MTKVLVIGTGAIGGFYGGKLSQAGAQVSVVCRSDYEVVKRQGISIKSILGNFQFNPHEVLKDVKDYHDEADFILLTTKVLPEIDEASLIKPALGTNTSIVIMQNGINIEKNVVKSFPNHRVISALAFICVERPDYGMINHQDYGRLVIGDIGSNKISEKAVELVELWNKSGVPCEAVVNIQLERWRKLVWNAAFNPISVLAGKADTKKILANEATRLLVRNVMNEICLLAEADGCKLPDDVIEKNISATEVMKPYKTSMLLDFEAGRKMEVEAILGNCVRFAKEKNIAIPYISTFYALLSNY